MRARIGLVLALSLSVTLGCQKFPTATISHVGQTATGTSSLLGTSTPTQIAAGVHPIPLTETPRLVQQIGQSSELIGKVKLISDKGLGLISNNSGALISDKGLGIIANNGGGLISDKGLGIIANNAGSLMGTAAHFGPDYRIAQVAAASGTASASTTAATTAQPTASTGTAATPQASASPGGVPESLLTDAQIEVLDGNGNVLVDENKKPIVAMSDAQGNYHFKAVLPAENLILRVRLYNGGQLFAFVTHDGTPASGARSLDIDTASTFGAAYVMSKYVQNRASVLALLPGDQADGLHTDMQAAEPLLGGKAPTYVPSDMVAQGDQLRGKSPALDTRYKEIQAILLAGQKDLGNGLPATQVTLGLPAGVLPDGKGGLLISEISANRIRRVAPDGTISLFGGAGTDGAFSPDETLMGASFGGPTSMVMGPDGCIYVAEELTCRIRKITPDGHVLLVAGNGNRAQGPVGGPAAQSSIMSPGQLCFGPDGLLYWSEQSRDSSEPMRVLYIDAQGNLQQLATPANLFSSGQGNGFAIGKDGTMWVLDGTTQAGRLLVKSPGGQWQVLASNLSTGTSSRLAIGPDNLCYVSVYIGGQVTAYDTTGKMKVVAGTGVDGYGGDGGPATKAQLNEPAGMSWGADGTMYIADSGNGVVRAIGTDGTIQTIAGAQGLTTQGDSQSVAINQPGGVAVDPQGRLVFTEITSNTIKRLDGTQLTVIAGTTKGDSGDGGPATAAQFNTLSYIAYAGSNLYIVDSGAARIRMIDANGTITTVAGTGQKGNLHGQTSGPALSTFMHTPTGITIGPDGLPIWTDMDNNTVTRLNKDGTVTVLAGGGSLGNSAGDSGDGGPASAALLSHPTGITSDAQGNIYFADTVNMCLRKIDTGGNISTVVGMSPTTSLMQLIAGTGTQEGLKATQTAVIGPSAVTLDGAGNLYYAELGTANAQNLLGGQKSLPIPISALPQSFARVRRVAADGTVTTIVGPGGKVLSDPSDPNALKMPTSLAFDAQGRLIVGDAGLNQVIMIPKSAYSQ